MMCGMVVIVITIDEGVNATMAGSVTFGAFDASVKIVSFLV